MDLLEVRNEQLKDSLQVHPHILTWSSYIPAEVYGVPPPLFLGACHLPFCSALSHIVSPWILEEWSLLLFGCCSWHIAPLGLGELRHLALSSPNQAQNVLLKHSTGLPSNNVLHFAFHLNSFWLFQIGSFSWMLVLCFSALLPLWLMLCYSLCSYIYLLVGWIFVG